MEFGDRLPHSTTDLPLVDPGHRSLGTPVQAEAGETINGSHRPVVAWLASFVSITLYNGYYRISLDQDDLPIGATWAGAIALKSENGGWGAFTGGPYMEQRTVDSGSYFTVMLLHGGDGCRKKFIDVEKKTGNILRKRTDASQCEQGGN